MAAQLFYGARTPVTAGTSQGSTAAGYPATNILLPQVLRSSRSQSVRDFDWYLDFGTTVTHRAVAITGCNFTKAAVSIGDTVYDPAFDYIYLAGDAQGRYKGALSFSAKNGRYVRFYAFGANSLGTAPYMELGAAYAFASLITLPRDPLYGSSSIAYIYPQVRNDLPNGIVEHYDAGPSYAELDLAFAGTATDNMELLPIRSRAGVCWLDLGRSDRGQQWPVRHHEPRVQRRLEKHNRELLQIQLKEEA